MQALTSDTEKLAGIARDMRVAIIESTTKAATGHPTTSLSCVEILTSLYFSKMKWDPKDAALGDRDRLIMSKGHGVPAMYAALAIAGAIPREELDTLRQTGSRLQGHPDPVRLPFVEAATGSLGQGLSIAMGIALAHKLDANPGRVFCLMGDGEIQEGQVWEAAMSAPKFGLGNLCAIIDVNGIQQTSSVENILSTLNPIADKWRAFSWNVLEIDGHDLEEISDAIDAAAAATDNPTVIVANTVKGKGVSFMADDLNFHGKAATPAQADQAIKEIVSV